MVERLTVDGWRFGVVPTGFELAQLKGAIREVLYVIGGCLFASRKSHSAIVIRALYVRSDNSRALRAAVDALWLSRSTRVG